MGMVEFWGMLGIGLVDLCSTAGYPDRLFTGLFLASGMALAAAAFGLRQRIGRASRFREQCGVLIPLLGMVLSAPAGFLAFAYLIPDPRDNGYDCGYTPDAIMLPLLAGLCVPLGFALFYGLLRGLKALRSGHA